MFKITIALLAVLAICSAANIKCSIEERKNQICDMSYRPVCGLSVSADNASQLTRTTYSNRCQACANQSVIFLALGECDLYPKNATFCHPDASNQKFCTQEYNPVCGMFDQNIKCFRAPCGMTFGNKCSACTSSNVAYHVPGDCEKAFNNTQ